jgi:hypothetical protein
MSLYEGPWASCLIPLCGPRCDCPSPGKNPHQNLWQHRAAERYANRDSSHLPSLRRYIREGGNVGLALPPGVVALDVDESDEAVDGILALCDEHPRQRTAGGVHILGRTHDTKVYASHYGRVPITVRHAGNQIVVEPSVHHTGFRYTWEVELPEDPELVPYFDPTLFRSEHRTGGTTTVLKREASEDEVAWRERVSAAWLEELLDPELVFEAGRRHEARLWLVWHLVVCGLEDEAIEDVLLKFNHHRCSHEGRVAGQQGRAFARGIQSSINGARRRLEVEGE